MREERISLHTMGQLQRRAVYGKSVRARLNNGGWKNASYSTGWGFIWTIIKNFNRYMVDAPEFISGGGEVGALAEVYFKKEKMNREEIKTKKRMNKMDAKQKMMAISFVAVMMMCVCVGTISAKTWTACKGGGGDFEIIQDTIDIASTGNIIYNYEGTCPNIFDVIENEAYNEAVKGAPFSPPLYAPMGTYCPLDYPCLTYQEYQCIDVIEPWNNNYVDEDNWWMQQRPRGGANIVPITLYRCNAINEMWEELLYDVNLFNWCPVNLTPENIPAGAHYHAGFKVGHENGSGGWPELANFRGNGYVRITDYPPACYGGSFRPLAHNMFFDDEDFPILTKVYSNIISTNKATSVFKVESEDFTGVLSADMQFYPPSDEVKIEVVSKYYSRKNLSISTENVSIIALNSMFWLDENDTPETPNDEAHDSDTVMIHYRNGTWVTHPLDNPTSELSIITLGRVESGDKIYIAQQDRDPSHYEVYRPESPYKFRSSYSINILYTNRPDLVVKIYEDKTNDECADNILVAIELTNNLTQGDEIHIEYILEAYYGPGVKITSIHGNRTFINIGWVATDPEGLPINITIEFGDGTDNGWIPIVENTSNDGLYCWNTTDITPGHYYLKISAINSKGDIGWDIADAIINPILCDLNDYGNITPADAVIALQLTASGAHNTAQTSAVDNPVTSLDALMILQVATGAIGLCEVQRCL